MCRGKLRGPRSSKRWRSALSNRIEAVITLAESKAKVQLGFTRRSKISSKRKRVGSKSRMISKIESSRECSKQSLWALIASKLTDREITATQAAQVGMVPSYQETITTVVTLEHPVIPQTGQDQDPENCKKFWIEVDLEADSSKQLKTQDKKLTDSASCMMMLVLESTSREKQRSRPNDSREKWQSTNLVRQVMSTWFRLFIESSQMLSELFRLKQAIYS
jgi:hypothetical protein